MPFPTFRLLILGVLGVVIYTITILSRSTPQDPQDHTNIPYKGPETVLPQNAQHGFLDLPTAQRFCQRRRWEVYQTRDRRRKIYDLVLINTELDWLEIRLHELDAQVDHFVILESPQTFQEGPKALYFQAAFDRFAAFHPKIIHRVVNFTDVSLPAGDTWEHERFTRNALFTQVLASLSPPHAPSEGDVLVVGDVDEIPKPSTLTALRDCAFPPRVTLMSNFYYYSFQWQHRGPQWPHPQATYYATPGTTVQPEDLRTSKPHAALYNAAWHCSSCMPTLADLKTKIASFSHRGYNQPYFLDEERLVQKVRGGEDLFERAGEVFDRVDGNLDVPGYILREENRGRFAYMLDRDPENANFQDK